MDEEVRKRIFDLTSPQKKSAEVAAWDYRLLMELSQVTEDQFQYQVDWTGFVFHNTIAAMPGK